MRMRLVLPLLLAACGGSEGGGDGGAAIQSTTITGATTAGIEVSGTNEVDVATGRGTLAVSGADGAMRCSGTYDAVPIDRVLTIPLTCDGGVTGTAEIERDATLMSGVALAELSDGTRAQAVFGALDYAETFASDPASADDVGDDDTDDATNDATGGAVEAAVLAAVDE